MNTPLPNVLSIAGSDPSGGAGIQADLKTFAALGCHGMAIPAALTAQNTQGVSAIHIPPEPFVTEQMRMIFADIGVAAIKTGMLGTPGIVHAVARVLAGHGDIPVVVDPVLVSTSGTGLASSDTIEAFREALFARARLVTPNLAEAARLADTAVPVTRADMEAIAARLHARHNTAWLIKGGHGEGASSDDVLFDGARFQWFSAPRIATRNTHGTGCTLSSAIAAYLARGYALPDSVGLAKAYLGTALAGAGRLNAGHGPGPLDHFAPWRDIAPS